MNAPPNRSSEIQTLAAVQQAHLDLEAVARQDGVDAGATQAGLSRQAVRTHPPLAAQLTDARDHQRVVGARLAAHRASSDRRGPSPLGAGSGATTSSRSGD